MKLNEISVIERKTTEVYLTIKNVKFRKKNINIYFDIGLHTTNETLKKTVRNLFSPYSYIYTSLKQPNDIIQSLFLHLLFLEATK